MVIVRERRIPAENIGIIESLCVIRIHCLDYLYLPVQGKDGEGSWSSGYDPGLRNRGPGVRISPSPPFFITRYPDSIEV